MTAPSWRQLAQIPESMTKRAILHALGIEPPSEGISNNCDLGDGLTLFAGEGGLIVAHHADGTQYSSAREVLKRHRLSKGIPSGDLARWWLQAKGYLP